MFSSDLSVRDARESDAAALLEIYAPYVLETAVSFETVVPSLEEFRGRIREIAAHYPYLVCERGGEIIGYAYAHRHQQREGYRYSAELTVYISESCRARGAGSLLYSELIGRLRKMPVRNLYAAVCVPNPASEALHRKFGFHEAGLWRGTGYKLGKWRDIGWFELVLDEQLSPNDF